MSVAHDVTELYLLYSLLCKLKDMKEPEQLIYRPDKALSRTMHTNGYRHGMNYRVVRRTWRQLIGKKGLPT